MERRNLSNLRLSELFNIAKSLNIKYIIRKYNKADLIKAIIKAEEQLHKDIKNGKKSIMLLRNSEIFSFDDDLFAKPKKKRVKKIKCDICGKYIKSTRMQLHKEKENKKNLKHFSLMTIYLLNQKKLE
jgi:formylmethanofuran dehydrogenase subunit E